jgi:WD40 repeat protein
LSHIDLVRSVTWLFGGTQIASASDDGTVQIWDATTGKNVLTYKGFTDSAISKTELFEDTPIISGSEDDTLQIWDAATGKHPFTYPIRLGKPHTGEKVVWSPNGTRIARVKWDCRQNSYSYCSVQIYQAV